MEALVAQAQAKACEEEEEMRAALLQREVSLMSLEERVKIEFPFVICSTESGAAIAFKGYIPLFKFEVISCMLKLLGPKVLTVPQTTTSTCFYSIAKQKLGMSKENFEIKLASLPGLKKVLTTQSANIKCAFFGEIFKQISADFRAFKVSPRDLVKPVVTTSAKFYGKISSDKIYGPSKETDVKLSMRNMYICSEPEYVGGIRCDTLITSIITSINNQRNKLITNAKRRGLTVLTPAPINNISEDLFAFIVTGYVACVHDIPLGNGFLHDFAMKDFKNWLRSPTLAKQGKILDILNNTNAAADSAALHLDSIAEQL